MKGRTIGVVGAGTIATTAHLPVLRAMASVEISWITDADEERGREAAQSYSARFVPATQGIRNLPACDAVLLAIPILPRAAYLEHFATTQSAVLAEKPLANDARAHADLVSRFGPWQLAVGYQRRQYATSLLLRSAVHSQMFGPLIRFRVAEGGRVVRTGGTGGYQDLPAREGGGIVKNLGCHSLDLALWITSAREFRIHDRAIEWDGETDRKGAAAIDLIDVAGNPGQTCRLDWTVSGLDSQPNVYELEFAGGSVRCPITPADRIDVYDRESRLTGHLQPRQNQGATTSAQAFYLEWKDLLEAVETRLEPMLSARSSLGTARLIDELLEA